MARFEFATPTGATPIIVHPSEGSGIAGLCWTVGQVSPREINLWTLDTRQATTNTTHSENIIKTTATCKSWEYNKKETIRRWFYKNLVERIQSTHQMDPDMPANAPVMDRPSDQRRRPPPLATQPNAYCCPLFQPNWFDKQMAETTACHFCHTVDNFFI
ncbi:hypothetical protein Tsp_02758 [Trichinella spiralis]|uniref:hypothetical protein n=1 Tax=Trichinella spiralis TaxID=6334 RepID=UPI0001EFC37E|nr:hypothetical protein Tsp_02758 [Trichinella spiralis]